jgi:hypothetical protein
MSLHPYETDFARQILLHKFYSIGASVAPLFVRMDLTPADRALGKQMGITVACAEEFSRSGESGQLFDAATASRPWGFQEIARACGRVASGGAISFTAPDSRYVRRAINPIYLAKMASKQPSWSIATVLSHLNSIGFVCVSICAIGPSLSSPLASESVFPTAKKHDAIESSHPWVKQNALKAINYLGLRTTPDLLFCAKRK